MRRRIVQCAVCNEPMVPSVHRQQQPLRRRWTCPDCCSWVELLAGRRGLHDAHWRKNWAWF